MGITFEEQKPIFLAIANWLEDAILSGAFAEESQIPSITEISVQYKINPATALKGVNLLAEAGLLYKKRGLGMFVAAEARQRLISLRRQHFFGDYIVPLTEEALHLGIGQRELQQMIERGYEQNGD